MLAFDFVESWWAAHLLPPTFTWATCSAFFATELIVDDDCGLERFLTSWCDG
jgi:hypothetical protein